MQETTKIPEQVKLYPQTRYMGSKTKLLPILAKIFHSIPSKTALDLFSGSGVVSYLLKSQNKQVYANDFMALAATYSKAMVENSTTTLSETTVSDLLAPNSRRSTFVADNFAGIYFSDDDNQFIDNLRSNIEQLDDEYEKAIALTSLARACMKKRPRGIFTYTGMRYDDGRKDLRTSFSEHFRTAVRQVNASVFDNRTKCMSLRQDALKVQVDGVDVVYIDPPYYSPFSDNDYVRRYHFVEGLVQNWVGLELQAHTKTKKFKSYPSAFGTKAGAEAAFQELFSRYADSTIVVSYSTNSLPDQETILDLLSTVKSKVQVIPVNYTYSFGNQQNASKNRNQVKELVFIGSD